VSFEHDAIAIIIYIFLRSRAKCFTRNIKLERTVLQKREEQEFTICIRLCVRMGRARSNK